MKHERGFTLVELMVAIVVVGVLLALAAPSLYDFILLQRLKSTNAQLVTELQFARSEAISRGVDVQVNFRENNALSCYSIYADSSAYPHYKCDCTQAIVARCTQPSTREIRTVQLPTSLGVSVHLPPTQANELAFRAVTGGIERAGIPGESQDFAVEVAIDASRKLITSILLPGRISVCSPNGGVAGYAVCSP